MATVSPSPLVCAPLQHDSATGSIKRWICASLVVRWLRIYLSMQGTWLPSLVQEDPICCRATKPVSHQLLSLCSRAMLCSKRSHCHEKPAHRNEEYPCSLQLEKACVQQQRPSIARSKINKASRIRWHLPFLPLSLHKPAPFSSLRL